MDVVVKQSHKNDSPKPLHFPPLRLLKFALLLTEPRESSRVLNVARFLRSRENKIGETL